MGGWKAVLPAVIGLVIAVCGSLFLYSWLKAKTIPDHAVQIQSKGIPVIVTASNLPWGTKLKSEMLKKVLFLEESLPSGYFSDTEALKGRVLISEVRQNEPVTECKLAPESVTVGGVSAVLTPGKRAVAVKGDKVIGLSGFIRPGNRVDVLVTLRDPVTKTETTKIVLENIQVLASGTEIQESPEGKPAPVDVYTLEVTPEEAEKLALASNKGRLQFALRNVIDTESVLTSGATIRKTLSSLSNDSKEPQKKKVSRSSKRKPRATHRTHTVEVIKEGKVVEQKFKVKM